MDFDRELDARGLNCPLPILRTKKALTGMQSGQVLKVLATDPGAVKDFQTFSRQTGHELLSHAEANKEFNFFMRYDGSGGFVTSNLDDSYDDKTIQAQQSDGKPCDD